MRDSDKAASGMVVCPSVLAAVVRVGAVVRVWLCFYYPH